MDAAEYKHVVLGLIFLKYISDSFGAIPSPKLISGKTRLHNTNHQTGNAA